MKPLIMPNLLYHKDRIEFALCVKGYTYTTSGVRHFQKENGLMVTGIVDNPTYFLLTADLVTSPDGKQIF